MDSNTLVMLGFLVFMFVVFYFLIIRPQRRRQQEQQQAIAKLQPGDRIITIGGVYGQIDSMSEDSFVIRVESGALLRISRQAVAYRQADAVPELPK